MSEPTPEAKQGAEKLGAYLKRVWELDLFSPDDGQVTPELVDFFQQAINAATTKKFEKLRAILRERSKGEIDTWGFVAAFMDMIDEVEKP